MQSITALAHLRAAVLYFVDISEQCGYTINQQVALFNSIRPLFTNKPLLVVLNKIDVTPVDSIKPSDRELLDSISKEAELVSMSTLTEEGVQHVKQIACDKLLAQRVENKLKGKKLDDVINRLHLAQPKPRDTKTRPPVIPESVFKARELKSKMLENGEDEDEMTPETTDEEQPFWLKGFNSIEWKKKYKLKNPEWRFDVVPEIIDGVNIADYVDPDIMKKLEELEQEEEERMAKLAMEDDDDDDLIPLTEEQLELVKQIREKKALIKLNHEMLGDKQTLPKKYNKDADHNVGRFEKELTSLGIDPSKAVDRLRTRSRSQTEKREARKRSRSTDGMEVEEDKDMMDTEENRPKKLQRALSASRSRSRSKTPAQEGLKDFAQKLKVQKLAKKVQKEFGKDARKGESDRHVFDFKPKHLLSGKRKGGKADRR